MGRNRRSSNYSSTPARGCLCNLCCSCVQLIFTLGLTVLIFWLIYRPHKLTAHVDSASLTKFNLSDSTALNYDLALDVSVRNPNTRISFYYDYIEAQAFYSGSNLGNDKNLPVFYQRHKNTTVLHLRFGGQARGLGSSVNGTFSREKGEGNFNFEVKIFSKVRVKTLFLKFGHFKPRIDCTVKIPVPGMKRSGGGFEATQCDVDF